jgi:flagellar hook-length control protein FliK
MSSLRINQQSRATGTPPSNAENSRPGAADGDASFAVALGAANAPLKQAATWLGGQGGDPSDGTSAPRKRSDSPGKPDAAAAALAAAGSLAAAGLGQHTTAAASGGNTTGTMLGSTGQVLAAAAPTGSRQSLTGSTIAAQPAAGATRGVETTSPPGTITSSALADGGTAATAVSAAVTGEAGPGDPSAMVAHSPGAGAPAATDSSGTATTLGSSSDPAGGAMSGADAVVAAATSPAPTPSTSSSSGVAPALAAAALSPLAAALTSSGQPGFGGGPSDGGASERGRYTSIAATPASGDATTAAALGTDSGPTTSAAAGGATPTPGAGETNTGALSDQVTNQLLHLVSSGSREMTMRLHPAELGDLTVRVAVSGRDVSAWFASPQPQVQSAISAALGQLQINLGNAGYNLTGAWVGADASGSQQQGSGQPVPPPISASSASPSAALPTAAAAVSRPSASGLNVYV